MFSIQKFSSLFKLIQIDKKTKKFKRSFKNRRRRINYQSSQMLDNSFTIKKKKKKEEMITEDFKICHA